MDIRLVSVPVEGAGSCLVVPGEFFSYSSLDSAEMVSLEGRSRVIRFGRIGRRAYVFLDEGTGAILSGAEPNDVVMVNGSIEQFTSCVRRVAEMFPFYAEDSEYEEWEEAAQRVQAAVSEVDPDAYREGSFWYEFRWDVSMGDFYG